MGIAGNIANILQGGAAHPERASASPGDVFPADPDITASDSTNAAKLAGEGFVAYPTTAWTTGQNILIGSYAFNWTGSAWAPGTHALAFDVAGSNVNEVQDYVTAHPEDRAAVLDAELTGRNRVTLVAWLQSG